MAGPDTNELSDFIVPKALEEKTSNDRRHTIFRFKSEIVWKNVIAFSILHCMGLYGGYMLALKLLSLQFGTFVWHAFLLQIASYGVTMAAHRYWTHRTFKAKQPLRVILILLQTLSAQNCLYIWARDHRLHHKYSDTDADPHNAKRGFFFSHIGWLMMKKHPEVARKGKTIDMSDLKADPLVMFQMKYYYYLFPVIALLIPIGVPVWLWNEDLDYAFFIVFFKSILIWNGTWCVNSVAHIYGNKPYDKNILPSESAFTALICHGEGWHNYHHTFPWDYKTSELKSSFNTTRMVIDLCAKIGWAYDLRIASPELVQSKAKRSGDGSLVMLDQVIPSEECNNNISKKK